MIYIDFIVTVSCSASTCHYSKCFFRNALSTHTYIHTHTKWYNIPLVKWELVDA